LIGLMVAFMFLFFGAFVHASVTPTISFSQTDSSTIQITVYGDPYASAVLHYGTSSTTTLGTTDQSGNLSVPLNFGSYNLVCGNTAYVVVDGIQSSTIPWSLNSSSCGSITFSQTAATLNVGQSITISSTSNSNLYLSTNSNSTVASASVIGSNQVYITALNAGTTNVTICANDGTKMCGTIAVSVQSTGSNTSTVTFNQNNIILSVGQSQAITISGSGSYYIASNSSSASVTATLNGNTLNINGVAFGGSSINVCQNSGGCGILYVVVQNATSSTTQSTLTPELSALSVSLSNISNGQFKNANNLMTLNFSTNESISMPSVYIGGNTITVSGSGSGPYVANYTMTGNETSFPVVINFTSLSGVSGGSSFSLSPAPTSTISPAVPISPVLPDLTTSTIPTPSNITFVSDLKLGSTGAEVRSLQSKLKSLKFYTGKIDGGYGAGTEKAVKAFQKAHKLPQTGGVGPKTRALLNE